MDLMNELERKFENVIKDLPDNEKATLRSLKLKFFGLYNSLLKPLMIAIFLFWTFDKIKNLLGLQDAIFIQLTVIIILLRMLLSKFS